MLLNWSSITYIQVRKLLCLCNLVACKTLLDVSQQCSHLKVAVLRTGLLWSLEAAQVRDVKSMGSHYQTGHLEFHHQSLIVAAKLDELHFIHNASGTSNIFFIMPLFWHVDAPYCSSSGGHQTVKSVVTDRCSVHQKVAFYERWPPTPNVY